MLEELKKVLAGIRRDTQRLLDNTLKSYLQIARYDVTTAPNGTVIGVTRPFSDTEIQIPYLPYCASAKVGNTVLVVWWGSLTNAQAWFKLPADWDEEVRGDLTVDGTLDVVPRRCYGALSSAGWYRAGYIKDIVRGNRTYSLTIRIATQGADMHIITLVGAPSSQLSFCNEASKASVLSIDKIRVTNINGNGYIDVHYALSSGIYVRIDFDDWSAGVAGSNAYFTAESLQAVADAPSGETVIASYNFAANTNGDISSLITFNNATYARAVRRGNLVNISFQGNSRTWAESEYLCTLPSSLAPSIVHWPVGYLNGSPVALRIDTTGIQIWIQPPTPTGRLYFDCTYIIA